MPGAWRRFVERLGSVGGTGGGDEGGGAGAGFHLWWKGLEATEPIVACSVVLEVLEAPRVPRLYFWALQASFVDGQGQSYGAAHTGLQWNPRHPGSRAVNWGGYGNAANVQSILDGTDSPLPGFSDDRNTRHFAWRERVPYRFEIHHGRVGWAATVTDLVSGSSVTIRELRAGGDRLNGFVMWSELFCRGDDPATTVRWSAPSALTASGRTLAPTSLQVTYPAGEQWRRLGVTVDEVGVCQASNVQR